MSDAVSYRAMEAGEESEVSQLVMRVFRDFVAPDYSDEGVDAFAEYAQPDALESRQERGHFVLVAVREARLVGMIEMRELEHVALLFVEQPGRGIGRELLERALAICRQQNSDLSRVTVNSSPYAVSIYERLGFRATDSQLVADNGIVYVPMILELSGEGPGADGAAE